MSHPFRRRSPRLCFNGTEVTGSSTPPAPGTPPTPPAPPAPPADAGFPANTAVADMTDKEQANYWKFHSRKHEKLADERADYDDLKQKAARLTALEDSQKTADQKAIDEAHRQGESVGADRFLLPAVEGRLAALTGKPVAELTPALELLDLKKFLNADGTGLDEAKVTTFATTLGTAPATPPAPVPNPDPIGAALAALRGNQGDQTRTGGSIADMQKQIIEARKGKTNS